MQLADLYADTEQEQWHAQANQHRSSAGRQGQGCGHSTTGTGHDDLSRFLHPDQIEQL